MSDIKIYCNEERGKKFIKDVEQKRFLFSFVISYTETCEIPGITVAGADADFIKFTPPADAEFLHYGSCCSEKFRNRRTCKFKHAKKSSIAKE